MWSLQGAAWRLCTVAGFPQRKRSQGPRQKCNAFPALSCKSHNDSAGEGTIKAWKSGCEDPWQHSGSLASSPLAFTLRWRAIRDLGKKSNMVWLVFYKDCSEYYIDSRLWDDRSKENSEEEISRIQWVILMAWTQTVSGKVVRHGQNLLDILWSYSQQNSWWIELWIVKKEESKTSWADCAFLPSAITWHQAYSLLWKFIEFGGGAARVLTDS